MPQSLSKRAPKKDSKNSTSKEAFEAKKEAEKFHPVAFAKRASPAIEDILSMKNISGLRYCLVKWKDLPATYNSWESLASLRQEPSYASIVKEKGLDTDHSFLIRPAKLKDRSNSFKDSVQENSDNNQIDQIETKEKESNDQIKNYLKSDEESTSVADLRSKQEELKTEAGWNISEDRDSLDKFVAFRGVTLQTKYLVNMVNYYRKKTFPEKEPSQRLDSPMLSIRESPRLSPRSSGAESSFDLIDSPPTQSPQS